MGIRSSGRSPLNYEPAISAGFGGSELEMRAQQVTFTRASWAPAAHGGPQVGPEARTSSEIGRATSVDVPSLEYDGCAWLWWGVGDVSVCAGGCAETRTRAPVEGGKYERSVRRCLMTRWFLIVSGEFFRTHPVSGPSLCRGGRHRRLQVASRTRQAPCTRPHTSQEREPTLSST